MDYVGARVAALRLVRYAAAAVAAVDDTVWHDVVFLLLDLDETHVEVPTSSCVATLLVVARLNGLRSRCDLSGDQCGVSSGMG